MDGYNIWQCLEWVSFWSSTFCVSTAIDHKLWCSCAVNCLVKSCRVAEMVYSFLLPEVEKETMRRRGRWMLLQIAWGILSPMSIYFTWLIYMYSKYCCERRSFAWPHPQTPPFHKEKGLVTIEHCLGCSESGVLFSCKPIRFQVSMLVS